MSNFILTLHSIIPYIFLPLLIIVVFWSIAKSGKTQISSLHMALARITMVLAHIQLLVGLLVLFLGDAAKGAFSQGMGEVMKNSELRNRFVEHPSMMIIAIALITIGVSRAKRADDDKKKIKNLVIFYGMGLLFILIRIPYAQWLNL